MDKFNNISLLLFFFITTQFLAQEKYEKESRINQNEIPQKAILFLQPLALSSVKWFKEEGVSNTSIEAKFIHKKTKYSIEYDTLGKVEDIEIEVLLKDLDPNIKQAITTQLNSVCSKHRVIKVQKQFTGNEIELMELIKNNIYGQSLIVNYELVIRCQQSNKIDLYEFLYDNNGEQLTKSKIVFKNSSHLEY